jgi:hypothetical protein
MTRFPLSEEEKEKKNTSFSERSQCPAWLIKAFRFVSLCSTAVQLSPLAKTSIYEFHLSFTRFPPL